MNGFQSECLAALLKLNKILGKLIFSDSPKQASQQAEVNNNMKIKSLAHSLRHKKYIYATCFEIFAEKKYHR